MVTQSTPPSLNLRWEVYFVRLVSYFQSRFPHPVGCSKSSSSKFPQGWFSEVARAGGGGESNEADGDTRVSPLDSSDRFAAVCWKVEGAGVGGVVVRGGMLAVGETNEVDGFTRSTSFLPTFSLSPIGFRLALPFRMSDSRISTLLGSSERFAAVFGNAVEGAGVGGVVVRAGFGGGMLAVGETIEANVLSRSISFILIFLSQIGFRIALAFTKADALNSILHQNYQTTKNHSVGYMLSLFEPYIKGWELLRTLPVWLYKVFFFKSVSLFFEVIQLKTYSFLTYALLNCALLFHTL